MPDTQTIVTSQLSAVFQEHGGSVHVLYGCCRSKDGED